MGLAAPNAVNVNELNPALLYYTARTTYEAVVTGQMRQVQNAVASNRSGSATLGYLALSVPLSRRWGASLGLKPVTGVSYRTAPVQTVENDPTATAYVERTGSGGLSEVYLAQGVHVLRDLNIGATVSYVFGTIDQSTGTVLVPNGADPLAQLQILDREMTRYSDLTFRAGAHYRHRFSDKLNLNLAGVYTFPTKLDGTRTRTQERLDLTSNLQRVDTLSVGAGGSTLPALLQGGITLDNDKNWTASLDVARQQWSKFEGFNQPAGSLPAQHHAQRLECGAHGHSPLDPDCCR